MKFIDEAIISVQSGDGGAGCVSLRREKYVPRGGPDGGDGGRGGDVVLKSSPRKRTLYQFKFQSIFKAQRGGHGQGRQRTGKSGDTLTIEIPPGTIVSKADTGEILHDFTFPEENFVVAKGGRGGQGNKRFATSTHRTPRFAQPGEPGETLRLKLELKLLADVGIIGLPNAGKSTLISVISSARPKIADYPFTTLTPNLGMVKTDDREPFVVADIPGLIEGAHGGAGLGTRFLKHIERTRMLLHLIDAADMDPQAPLNAYSVINAELAAYRPDLAQKKQLIVLNKMDLPGAEENALAFQDALKQGRVMQISSATGKGIPELTYALARMLDEQNA